MIYTAIPAPIPTETSKMGDLQTTLQSIDWKFVAIIAAFAVGFYFVVDWKEIKRTRRRSAFQALKRKQRAQQKALIYTEAARKAEREAA